MTMQDYLNLRNGTDVRGVACEGVENEPVTLTEEAAENIAKAFCVWLISRTGKTKVTVAVGYDSRITAPALCEAVVRGITSTGHDAVVTGLSTKPSAFSLGKYMVKAAGPRSGSVGAVVVTGGRLPLG